MNINEEKNIKEIDFNNPTLDQMQSLVYSYLRNSREDEAEIFVAGVLSKAVNGYTETKTLVAESMKDHRTLLQNKMFFVFRMIAEAAKAYKEGWYDDRNEYTFKLATEIVETIKCETCYKDDKDCLTCKYHRLRLGS